MLDRDELAAVSALNRYVENHVAPRNPSDVVRAVVIEAARSRSDRLVSRSRWFGSRPVRIQLAAAAGVAVLVVLVVLAGAVILVGTKTGTGGTTAQVGGLEYEVGVARSLRVTPDDLTAYGEVTAYTDAGAYPFADQVAYAIRGIDPRAAILVRWAPGLTDDAGALGEYALLYRGLPFEVLGLCAYFDPMSDATPPECR